MPHCPSLFEIFFNDIISFSLLTKNKLQVKLLTVGGRVSFKRFMRSSNPFIKLCMDSILAVLSYDMHRERGKKEEQ